MKHALIIEDQALIAIMVAHELAELGYETASRAASQAEVFDWLKRDVPISSRRMIAWGMVPASAPFAISAVIKPFLSFSSRPTLSISRRPFLMP